MRVRCKKGSRRCSTGHCHRTKKRHHFSKKKKKCKKGTRRCVNLKCYRNNSSKA